MGILKQKLRAFSVHFAISLCVILSFLLFVYFVLYTPPILELEGGDEIALIIIGVDLVLGPLLTFILYRKGKPGLVFDLTLVAFIQIAAFLYGASILYSHRPLYLAHIKEHFEVIPASAVDTGQLVDKSLAPDLFEGPVIVFVEIPTGAERERIMFDALAGGKDYHFYPEYYRKYTDHIDAVRKRGWTLERIKRERPGAVNALEQSLKRLGRKDNEVFFSPVVGNSKDGAVILDLETGRILAHVDVVIWG